jgi:hypothetical protein
MEVRRWGPVATDEPLGGALGVRGDLGFVIG